MSADRQDIPPLIAAGDILRAYGCELDVPFRNALVCQGHAQKLQVDQVLRTVPRKRLDAPVFGR